MKWWAKHALATGKTIIELTITEHLVVTSMRKEYVKIDTYTTTHYWFEMPINLDMDIEKQVLELFPNMIDFKWREIE